MKKSSPWPIALAFVALVSACTVSPRSPDTAHASTAAPRQPLSERDHLTIAIVADHPEIGAMSPTNSDDVHGLDIDIATYVAKGLSGPNVRITWVPVTSKSREAMVTHGDVDLVVASYSITDYRLDQVDFAGPYLIGHADMAVRNADSNTITGVNDLKGRTVCTVEDTTSKVRLEQLNKDGMQPPARLLILRTSRACMDKLVKKEDGVDATVNDNVILAGYLGLPEFAGGLHLVEKPFAKESDYYGIGLLKGRTQDCKKINEILKKLINDGTWDTIVRRNMRTRPDLALKDKPIPGETVKTCRSSR
jgi:glutamate transport system substrate-binding protein